MNLKGKLYTEIGVYLQIKQQIKVSQHSLETKIKTFSYLKERKDQQRKVSQREGQIDKLNMEVWEYHQLRVDYKMKTMKQPDLAMMEHYAASIH